MLEFDEYKVWLNNFKPQLETLKASLGLDQAARELDLLQSQSAAPGFWDDPDKAQKTQQRIKALQDKIENQAKRERSWSDLVTLCEMGNEEEDASLLPELSEGCRALEEDVESARLATLLTGEYDNANAILTFHAGAGGTEAQDWAQMLFRMYTRWAERHGFTCETVDYLEGDEAGLKSATIMITGENAYGFLRGENGVHRLVRVSPFDARPPSPLWRSCLRSLTTWRWTSAPRTWRCRCFVPPARAASTSTKPHPPFASSISPRVLWCPPSRSVPSSRTGTPVCGCSAPSW